MKAINIIGIILGAGIFPLVSLYIEKVNDARWIGVDWPEYIGGQPDYNGPTAADVTFEGALIILLILIYFIFQNILNMVKVNRPTTRVLSIIGISISGFSLLYCFLMLNNPTHLSFDEGGQSFMLPGLMMIGFSIVFLIQYMRMVGITVSEEILDDDII